MNALNIQTRIYTRVRYMRILKHGLYQIIQNAQYHHLEHL